MMDRIDFSSKFDNRGRDLKDVFNHFEAIDSLYYYLRSLEDDLYGVEWIRKSESSISVKVKKSSDSELNVFDDLKLKHLKKEMTFSVENKDKYAIINIKYVL